MPPASVRFLHVVKRYCFRPTAISKFIDHIEHKEGKVNHRTCSTHTACALQWPRGPWADSQG